MSDRPETTAPDSEPAQTRRPRVRHRLRTPQEARQWRRRIAGYALIAVSFVLVVNAVVGENGYLATMRARREAAELSEQIRQLREENQRTRENIHRLQDDPSALEDAARELRLSKPGERMIIIKDAEKAGKPRTAPLAR